MATGFLFSAVFGFASLESTRYCVCLPDLGFCVFLFCKSRVSDQPVPEPAYSMWPRKRAQSAW